MKNGKKLYNERGITFFHEIERYVNNLNIYNRSKNGTNLWDDLILRYRINTIRIQSILIEQNRVFYKCILIAYYMEQIFS